LEKVLCFVFVFVFFYWVRDCHSQVPTCERDLAGMAQLSPPDQRAIRADLAAFVKSRKRKRMPV
jgi:hypothetical protein